MKWYLVITMLGSDDLLVKEMPSKEECVQVQERFTKHAKKKIKNIDDITCEEGEIMQSFDIGVNKNDEQI